MEFLVKKQITDHKKMSWENNPVNRFVEFIRFSRYDLKLKIVELDLLLTLESPESNIILSTYITYSLHSDIWFDLDGNVTTEELGVITELDYWLNKMVNVNVSDRILIEEGIENLDIKFDYFDQFL